MVPMTRQGVIFRSTASFQIGMGEQCGGMYTVEKESSFWLQVEG